MGDSLERFARGEKMKLSDQKHMYQQRIQEIWRRQRAALSSDPGDRAGGGETAGIAASVDTEPKPNSTDTPTLSKENIKEKEESDSESEDDDLAAMLEEDMLDVRETNLIVAAHVRGTAGTGEDMIGNLGQKLSGSQDLSKDARELAALKRQREEERLTKEGLLSGGKTVPNDESLLTLRHDPSMIGKKVVRKRITKTYPDGRQTTTFKFVVVPAEVDKIIARKREEDDAQDQKTRKHKGHKSAERHVIGHAMFEEEDEHKSHRSSHRGIKFQLNRTTRTIKGGAPPRMQKHKPQLGKFKQRESQEMRMHKRKRADDEADLYAVPSKRLSTNNRKERGAARDRMPHVILADKLESIRSSVEKRPFSGPFHKPVPRRAVPRYYEVISNPIDLQTIRDKNQR
jgi:hypothetical protein